MYFSLLLFLKGRDTLGHDHDDFINPDAASRRCGCLPRCRAAKHPRPQAGIYLAGINLCRS